MHDFKYLTSRVFTVQDMEHTFDNFSTVLQSGLNGRKKLFVFDERNNQLVEKSEMHSGWSDHAFVEVLITGEQVAIGGWDGEQSMNQT
jgi:hypothetical protein